MLAGKIAVVTGGGSGIGRAVCSLFAKEGARVIVADIDEKAALNTVEKLSGEKHQAEKVNVAQSDSVQNLFSKIQSKFSCIPTVIVNCAGITRDAFLIDMTEQMFDEVIKINLKGTFLVTQTASKLMIQEKITNGSIVNISSVVGKVGNMGQCNYAASKAGVVALTKSAAKELAKYGIRCNAVMPGFIDTPMVSTVPEKVMDNILKQIPLRRKGKPEEIAEVCAFLASCNSSYITGEIIQVSGGLYM